MALDEDGGDGVREPGDLTEIDTAVERDDDVEPFRAGRLDPARQVQLLEEQIAKQQGRRTRRFGIVRGRIEIEDTDVGAIQVWRAESRRGMMQFWLASQSGDRASLTSTWCSHRLLPGPRPARATPGTLSPHPCA
jgi:hypothetical protein